MYDRSRIDVRLCRGRLVDPRSIVILFDFGPSAPKPPAPLLPDADAEKVKDYTAATQRHANAMRAYEMDRADWEKVTGGRPCELALNAGVEEIEYRSRDPKRWRKSLAEAEMETLPQPKTIAGQIDLTHLQGVLQASWLVADNVDNVVRALPTVDAREFMARHPTRYSLYSLS